MATLNLGIVAHVDAGKTSLTERLLYDAGVISAVGGVDRGDTQTDTDELERTRGITIRSAVVGFDLGDLHVNLIDTPGHSDFIAEVERSLAVLDAAVLVISAVEGVQSQTRVLMRTLRRMRIPTMIFVNKIDRMGARSDGLLDDIRTALSDRVLAMTRPTDLGTADAAVRTLPAERSEVIDLVTERDDELLRRYVEQGRLEASRAIAAQTASAELYPLYFGSAITGAGVAELTDGLRCLLPRGSAVEQSSLHARIFKIDTDDGGEKIAYIRIFSGTLAARDQVRLWTDDDDPEAEGRTVRPTAVRPFAFGTGTTDRPATAGEIAKVRGLRAAAIGDQLGRRDRAAGIRLAKPGLESVVTPARVEDRIALHAALEALAEQDPLINLHLDGSAIAVSLYGEVQGEVLRSRLLRDFGISADFEPARTVYVEKPSRIGSATMRMGPGAMFDATIGLRVEPGPAGSGARYVDATPPGHMPAGFHRVIADTVAHALRQGPYGWQLTDCVVTLFERDYSPPSSTGSDFRNLAPLVLAAALRRSRTRVCEPLNFFEIDAPAGALRPILRLLTSAGAALATTDTGAHRCEITGEVPAAEVYRIGKLLPGLTQGDGAFWSRPSGHRRVSGRPPIRERTDGNPYNRKEYLMFLAG